MTLDEVLACRLQTKTLTEALGLEGAESGHGVVLGRAAHTKSDRMGSRWHVE